MERKIIYPFYPRMILGIVFAILSCSSLTSYAQCQYNYSKTLTINSSQVSGSTDLVDFPLLVSITDPDLATTGNGGNVENTDGYDIRFMLQECSCWLDHEIESYNQTTGTYIAWVRIPSLNATENTLIEMYYGNSSISLDPSTTRTWTTDYVGVWHLNEDPQGSGPQHADATGTGNNGTAEGGVSIVNVVGIAGNGVSFDGVDDLIEIPDDNTLDLTTNATISFWFDLDGESNDDDFPRPVSKGQSTASDGGYGIYVKDVTDPTEASFRATGASTQEAVDNALTNYDDANWHYVVGTYDGSTMTLYFDGNSEATTSTTISFTNVADPLHIGDGLDQRHWNGKIDEVRISNEAKSSDWVATEFANQSDPASFYSLGNQKEGDCTGPGGVGQMDGTSSLVLWFKSDCGVENSDYETVGNGEDVGVWRDQSGFGIDAVESTTRQPTYQTNQVQGLPSLDFEGASVYAADDGDFLLASGVDDSGGAGSGEFMIFIVAEESTSPVVPANHGLFIATDGNGVGAAPGDKSIGMWVDENDELWGRIIESDATTHNYTQTTSLSPGTNTYYIIANYGDGIDGSATSGTSGQYLSGIDGSVSINYDGTVQGWSDVGIGIQGLDSWDGHIAEVVVFNSYLSESERGQVEDYLALKYGAELPRLSGSTGPAGLGDSNGSSRLETWYDALDLDADGSFEGTSEGGQSGGTVSTWADKSGNGRDLSTGSATYTTSNAGLNNFPSVDFDGSTEYLQSGNIQIADQGDLEMLIAFDDGGFNGLTNSLVNWRTAGDIGGIRFEGTTNNFSNDYYQGFWTFSTTGNGGAPNNAFTTSDPYIYTAALGSSGRTYTRNGTQMATNGAAIDITNTSAPLAIGRNISTGGNYFAADVSELIMFSTELNAAEREIAEQYLSEKYNIALSGTDYYSGHTGSYDYEVQGIGTSDGTIANSHVESNASNGLKVSMLNGSFDAAAEYVFTGYEDPVDGTTTDDLGGLPSVELRYSRVWYLDVTGTVDITLTFNTQEISGSSIFPAGNGYVLLYSASDPYSFSDWTADNSINPTVSNEVISFNVTSTHLADGYYTVGTTDAVNNPLPVELMSFEVEKCGSSACLSWETASETNNDRFEILRSLDQNHWIQVGTIDGNGTTSDRHSYSFVDNLVPSGTSYYRLRQVDFDGSLDLSVIKSIEFLGNSAVSIFPNPSRDVFYLEGESIEDNFISVCHISGKTVSIEAQTISRNKISIDFTKLVAGIYLVTYRNGDRLVTERLIYTGSE